MATEDLFGEVIVNGFRGSAKFQMFQRFSTITPRLAQGLESFMVSIANGRSMGPAVRVPLILGSNLSKINWTLYLCNDCDTSEVVFGNDFRRYFQTNFAEPIPTIMSPIFGEIRCTYAPILKFALDDSVILLVDMDCFAVQVYGSPNDAGKPRVVFSGPVIESLSYEAKERNVKRCMTEEQALKECPELVIIENPERKNGCPDRIPGMKATAKIKKAILEVSNQYRSAIFEFSSKDEFYIDVTQAADGQENSTKNNLHLMIPDGNHFWPSVYLYGSGTTGKSMQPTYLLRRLQFLNRKRSSYYSEFERQEIRLLFGTWIASRIVENILKRTGYQASIGVGSNKVAAKIATGVHKPGSITVFPPSSYDQVSKFIEFEDVPGFASNLGDNVRENFGITTIDDLQRITVGRILNTSWNNWTEKDLNKRLRGCHFICDEVVKPISCAKSTTCTRRFWNVDVSQHYQLEKMLDEQYEEMLERLWFELRHNKRRPVSIKLEVNFYNQNGGSSNKSLKISGSPLPRQMLNLAALRNAFITENNKLTNSRNDSVLRWNQRTYGGVNSITITSNFEK